MHPLSQSFSLLPQARLTPVLTSSRDGAYVYLCIKEFTKHTRHFPPNFQVGKLDLLRLLAVCSQECAPLVCLAREGLKFSTPLQPGLS